MTTIHSHWINGNLVYYQSNNMQRWLDVVGPAVVKVKQEFQFGNYAVAAGDATGITREGWLLTFVEVGAGGQLMSLVAGADGGNLLITNAGNEDDGINMQVIGSSFNLSLTNAWPAYFGARFQISEATESDFVLGLCNTDTTLTAATEDGIYFRKADGSTAVSAVIEKTHVETTVAAWTAAANTWVIAEILFDGVNVDFYVNGTALTRQVATNIPNTVYLTPSFEFLNGSAANHTATFDWIRAFQLQT